MDLTSEVDTTIVVPRYFCLYDYGFMGGRPVLGVHGECLSVLCDFTTHWRRLWLLKESSLVMVGRLLYLKGPEPKTMVLCVEGGGEILLSQERAIVVYDPKIYS